MLLLCGLISIQTLLSVFICSAHSTTVAASVASMSQVQVRRVSQGPGAYNETGPEVVTVPVRGPAGTV